MQLVRRERYQGSYKRSFYVGDDLQQEDIKASFKNGILKLTIPKEVQKKLKKSVLSPLNNDHTVYPLSPLL